MAFQGLVRSGIDYCSSVWDPHLKQDINKLEMANCCGDHITTTQSDCYAQADGLVRPDRAEEESHAGDDQQDQTLPCSHPQWSLCSSR